MPSSEYCLCAFWTQGAVSEEINLKSDTVLHMTGCCSPCLCVCCATGIVHCHTSAVCHLTLQQHFSKASLVIGGTTVTTVLLRGPDRDFNPYSQETG